MWHVERKKMEDSRLIHSDDTLCHYGVLGMKWGVRRYQNKDGSWTKKGKEHRRNSDDTEPFGFTGRSLISVNKSTTMADVKNNTSDPKLIGAMRTLNNYLQTKISYWMMDEDDQRLKDATMLAVKAANKIWPSSEPMNTEDYYKAYNDLYGAETAGIEIVADLVNQGYSAQEIKRLLLNAHEADRLLSKNDWYEPDQAFSEVHYSGYERMQEFADVCEDIYKREKNK